MQVLTPKIFFFVLLVMTVSCSLRTSTKVKKLTENFIEIEADTINVWVGCFEINPEDHLSLMNFYVKDGYTTHEFFYRRLLETKYCKSNLQDYKKLLKDAHRVTIVGITAKYHPEETTRKIEAVPEEFATGHRALVNWTFIRLQTEKGCEAYFSEDCEPENYWGGLIPEE